MTDGIFVTGGAGFVGRRVLDQLRSAGRPVVALDRSGALESSRPDHVTVVRGDLLSPASYQAALRGCRTVIHLAAATGKASADEHARVNAQGTQQLLDACRQAGVSQFLFVSSIASTFQSVKGYHYALAKLRGEDAVRQSGLAYAILRPTIILGPGAPILGALEKIATLPVMPMPGSGRARVQPIHVDDVARAIAIVVEQEYFQGEILEVGGPETLTIEALVRRLRVARLGRDGRVIHVPLWLLRPPLGLAEAAGLGRALPMTAGQLSSFQWDGVAAGNRLQTAIAAGLQPLAAMLEPRATSNAVGQSDAALAAECRILTRHVVGRPPDDYVVARYLDAHRRLPSLAPATSLDRTLMALASRHSLGARLADAFAALFDSSGVLRRKVVLLLAILETRDPFFRTIDGEQPSSRLAAITSLVGHGMLAVASAALATAVVLPSWAATRLLSRGRP